GLSRPNELLLLFRQITGKGRNTVCLQPHAAIADVDVGKDVCRRKLFLQTLRRFVFVGPECSQVDEARNTRIPAGCRYDRTAIGVTDQDGGLADAPERPLHVGDVLRMGVQTMLRGDHFVALSLQSWDEFAEAGAVGP